MKFKDHFSGQKSGLESKSIDLVTVAQALHWFDLDAFYAEAIRVLKPPGILAAWCYGLLEIAPEIDTIVNRFYDVVGPYWPPERKIVEDGYRTIPFPFEELESPVFAMQAHWSLAQLLGYLRTWSATQAFITAHGFDPTEAISADLSGAWGTATRGRIVRWPLNIRVGRVVPAV
jgi:SAM-dependent methyltransferase